VFYIQGEDFGQSMHPLDALAEYQRRIAVQPSNPDLYARMANSLRFIGRFEQALQAYRKAVELDAHNTETLYAAASAEHDFGDLESAHRLYERCLAVGRVNNTSLNYQFDQNVVTAMQGLKALERGQTSPWEYQLINASGKRLLPPARDDLTAHAGEKKDKRAKRHGKRH
jgi:tetratricopeptide (TPR) repeat protein